MVYDVIVAGGGPAGLGAAISAAKMGAKTMLLEGRSFFGGEATLGLWMPINRLFLLEGSRGGVHELLTSKLKSYKENISSFVPEDGNNGDGLYVHPEYFRLAAFELLEEANCSYRLYSPVTGAIMEGDFIKGVEVTTKNGIQKYYGKVIIDATGDGDVAFHAGAKMVKGREEDGQFMAHTLGFALCNVKVDKFLTYQRDHNDEFRSIYDNASKEDYLTLKSYWGSKTTLPDVLTVNTSGFGLGRQDGTKAEDLTKSERDGLQVAIDFVRIARNKKIPGLEDCYLMRTGANIGVRETRRIVGEYVYKLEDALEGKEFNDTIARKYGAVDAVYYFAKMKQAASYPYRCLLPLGVENLLVAGRCGSAEHLGHAAGKSMGNMMALGQAAGISAAICSKENITPRKVEVNKVQKRLIEIGVKGINQSV